MGVFNKKERGSNIIEFALLLPFYLMFLGVVCDYGVIFLRKASYTAMLNEGCRAGSMIDANDPSQPAPATVAAQESNNRLAAIGGATAVVSYQGVIPNRSLVCEVSEPYTPFTPVFHTFFPDNVESKVEVRLEWQRSSI